MINFCYSYINTCKLNQLTLLKLFDHLVKKVFKYAIFRGSINSQMILVLNDIIIRIC
jgi:hypothetical protein